MISEIYIDVSHQYDYDFSLHKHCAHVVQIQEGIAGTVTFVCNSAGKISDGDAYRVIFNRPQDEGDLLFFILKYPQFRIIETDKVEEYILRRRKIRLNTITGE